MSRGTPWVASCRRSTAPSRNVTALLLPAMPRRWKMYSSISSLPSGFIWQLMLILCRSCLSLGTARVCFNSGWPASIIWRSLFLSVSRLERRRTSSRSSGERFCASSIIKVVLNPCAYWLMMKSVSSLSSRVLSLPWVSIPKSSLIIAISCSELTSVLLTRATLISLFNSFSIFLRRVVLPVPTSPVTSMNPVPADIP